MTHMSRGRWSAPLVVAAGVGLALALSACSSSSSSSSSSRPSASSSPNAASTTTTASTPVVTPSTQAGGTVATGGVTCTNVTGMLTFTPPLKSTNTGAETTQISLTATGCTTTGSNTPTVTGASATGTIQSPTNSCTTLLNSKPVAVAVTWSPSSIHASVATFSGYSVTTNPANTAGDVGFALPGTGGTATVAGSFAGSDSGAKSSAAAYSTVVSTALLGACGTTGVPSLAIASGTVTFS